MADSTADTACPVTLLPRHQLLLGQAAGLPGQPQPRPVRLGDSPSCPHSPFAGYLLLTLWCVSRAPCRAGARPEPQRRGIVVVLTTTM